MKKHILFSTIFYCAVLLFPTFCYGKIYFQDDFEYSDALNKHGWHAESNIEHIPSEGIDNSRCVRVRYDHEGTAGYWFGRNVRNLNSNDIYVRFYFKRTSWVKGGCKFLKIFGKKNDPEGYANTSFALQYHSGNLVEVSYGAGHAYDNDSQDIIRLFGNNRTDKSVKVHTAKGTYKVPDDKWVCYEAHVKFNSNGKRDGEYQVWIDGELWLDAQNVKNRHDSNSKFIESIELANYSQPWESTWYLWYDNLVISDSYIGPIEKRADNTISVDFNEELELQKGEEGEEGNDTTGSILFKEDFDYTNFESRGWYDNTNIQLSLSEHISGSTSSAEFHFTQGATKPLSGGTMRRKFTDTDEVYVSYFIKYSSNWEGSNKPYHPHEFYLLTNVDDDWTGPAHSHLTAYIEQNEGEPVLGIQDSQNIDESKIGVDLMNISERRAVAGCNGDGDCYQVGSVHQNGKQWKSDSIYFRDHPGQYYKNDWHFVEAYFKLNTISGGKGVADGHIKYWYDGFLIIDHNDVIMRTAQHPDMKFNQFLIGPYIGDGSPVDQTLWIDNLIVATSSIQDTIPPKLQAGLTTNDDLQMRFNAPYQTPELVWLPQGIDLTKHTKGPFTVKIRVEGIDMQKHPTIFPRIRYYIGTGSSHGYFEMIHEGDNVWRFDIPDPNWYNYRSNSLHYHVKLFDEEGTVISESRWEIELIDSFIQWK